MTSVSVDHNEPLPQIQAAVKDILTTNDTVGISPIILCMCRPSCWKKISPMAPCVIKAPTQNLDHHQRGVRKFQRLRPRHWHPLRNGRRLAPGVTLLGSNHWNIPLNTRTSVGDEYNPVFGGWMIRSLSTLAFIIGDATSLCCPPL